MKSSSFYLGCGGRGESRGTSPREEEEEAARNLLKKRKKKKIPVKHESLAMNERGERASGGGRQNGK